MHAWEVELGRCMGGGAGVSACMGGGAGVCMECES